MTEIGATLRAPRTGDGVEILAVQPGTAPHPHPRFKGKLVPFRWLEELLLADGTSRWRCVKPVNEDGTGGPCGRDTFTAASSAVSHMNQHYRTGKPRYAIETLKLVVRLVKLAERDHGERNKCVIAARELNRRQVQTLNGEPWNAAQVSHLYNDYKNTVRVRIDPGASVETTREVRSADLKSNGTGGAAAQRTDAGASGKNDRSLAALDRRASELTRGTADLYTSVKKHAEDLADFVTDIAATLRELSTRPEVDPEIVEQAEKWRQAQALFGNK